MQGIYYLAFSFMFLLKFCENRNDHPYVNTIQGTVKGKFWTTEKGRTFAGFTGIPYGKPPINDLRFKAPVPAEPWLGELDATKPHEVCPQLYIYSESYPIVGNEDCLYLNVYTPKVPSTNSSHERLFSIMFYIHGGSFAMGSARDDWLGPELLLDEDVILVTINYRLGALGFLSTTDSLVPGNAGLKDQTLALRWVKSNILKFGGDPNKITVFGNSAGGFSAHYHLLSPLSKDLISGAIIQSGTATSPFGIADKDRILENTRKLGEFLNCSSLSKEVLVDCLKNVDAYEIVKQQHRLMENWDNDTTLMPFRPIVEDNHDGAFFFENPIDLIKAGKIAEVPIMVGMVSEEAGYKTAGISKSDQYLTLFNRYFDKIVGEEFCIACKMENVTRAIRKFYFNDKLIDNNSKTEITNMYSDGWWLTSTDLAVRLHINVSTQPTFLYLFEYKGSVSYSQLFGDPSHDYGVGHTDELLYLLPRKILFPHYVPTESDRKMADVMIALWTNFAKHGAPLPARRTGINAIWEPVVSDDLEYFDIRGADDLVMSQGLFLNRTRFWRNVPIEYKKGQYEC